MRRAGRPARAGTGMPTPMIGAMSGTAQRRGPGGGRLALAAALIALLAAGVVVWSGIPWQPDPLGRGAHSDVDGSSAKSQQTGLSPGETEQAVERTAVPA